MRSRKLLSHLYRGAMPAFWAGVRCCDLRVNPTDSGTGNWQRIRAVESSCTYVHDLYMHAVIKERVQREGTCSLWYTEAASS